MLMGFLLVHGTIAGDFRRAVKSLARQGRLEEAEDKNRKRRLGRLGHPCWSAQFTWRCSWRFWFKNYMVYGCWGYCYRMIYWNHGKWWFTEVLWWFNWILWWFYGDLLLISDDFMKLKPWQPWWSWMGSNLDLKVIIGMLLQENYDFYGGVTSRTMVYRGYYYS